MRRQLKGRKQQKKSKHNIKFKNPYGESNFMFRNHKRMKQYKMKNQEKQQIQKAATHT
jgi:hypothetical protein